MERPGAKRRREEEDGDGGVGGGHDADATAAGLAGMSFDDRKRLRAERFGVAYVAAPPAAYLPAVATTTAGAATALPFAGHGAPTAAAQFGGSGGSATSSSSGGSSSSAAGAAVHAVPHSGWGGVGAGPMASPAPTLWLDAVRVLGGVAQPPEGAALSAHPAAVTAQAAPWEALPPRHGRVRAGGRPRARAGSATDCTMDDAL